jgi:cephalosporin hydroxylase
MNGFISRTNYYVKFFLAQLVYKIFPKIRGDIVDDFHKFYYDSHLAGKSWREAKFLGIPIQKCPFDLSTYQEILAEVKPDLIIETGTAYGGGALYLASICELLGNGEVVTIDINSRPDFPKYERITYITGSSVSDEVVQQVAKLCDGKDTVMVILDSDHSKSHVLKELELYNKFVTKGSYLIVEDTNVNGHPVYLDHGPGPMEALQDFLGSNNDFTVDKSREKHYVTFNPNGYLRKKV